MAQSTELFGLRDQILEKLKDADYRNAMMLCRRALAGEQEHFATHHLPSPREGHMEHRGELLRLLHAVDSLRLEVRTRSRS